MTAQLYSNAASVIAATASSSAAGYLPIQAATPGVFRGWRSSAGGAQWLQFDLGSAKVIRGISVHALDAGGAESVTLLTGNTATPTANQGAVVLGRDSNGRIKGSRDFSVAFISARYVRFNVSGSGTAYSIGYAAIWLDAAPLAVDPIYSGSRLASIEPQVRADLPNGITETYSAGPPLTEVELAFRARASHDVDALRRLARSQPCWLDLGTAERGRQWPVRYHEPQSVRSLDGYNRESLALKLREII